MTTNGIIPITCTPPVHSDLGDDTYITCLGMCEAPDSSTAQVTFENLEDGLPVRTAHYRFKEFAFAIQNGNVVEVDLAGQTIDWSMSEISMAGTVDLELGVLRPYRLVPKVPQGHKYVFLSLEILFDDFGVYKPASWVYRRKVS